MAGLLDAFQDPQTAGLLSAAAMMLDRSGPSRTPTSFGQVLGSGLMGGLQGMQQAQQLQQRDAALRQQQEHMGLQNQVLGMNLKSAQSALDRQNGLRDVYKSVLEPTSNLPSVMSIPGRIGPTPERAQLLDGQGAATESNPQMATYKQHMALADALAKAGYGQEAQAAQDQALKFLPKLKEQKAVRDAQGNIVLANVDDFGNTSTVNGYTPAEKLSFHNLGNRTAGLDPFTGKEYSTAANGQSPDSKASNALGWANNSLAQQRLAMDRSNQNQPQFVEALGGFVFKPNAQAPAGGFTPLAGYTKPEKPLTESQGKAVTFASRMQSADQTINDLIGNGVKTPSLIKQSLDSVPLIGSTLGGIANATVASADQQKMEQAQRDYVNAVLRQESGASISPSEFENARTQYFPQPGDSAAVIEQKARNRQIALQGMKTQAGDGAKKVDAIAGRQQSKFFNIDGGGSVAAKLDPTDGNFYVVKNGKKYRVEE